MKEHCTSEEDKGRCCSGNENEHKHHHGENRCGKHMGKGGKFVQPCLLLLLSEGKSHGYGLLEKVKEFGFYEEDPDISVLYRNLNKFEKEGYVTSEWETAESGPAKKVYELTEEGKEYLKEYVGFFQKRKKLIDKFIETYKNL